MRIFRQRTKPYYPHIHLISNFFFRRKLILWSGVGVSFQLSAILFFAFICYHIDSVALIAPAIWAAIVIKTRKGRHEELKAENDRRRNIGRK